MGPRAMKITLENALTLVEGEIELEPGNVTLLFGANMKGKTSAITMIGGILSRDMNPAGLPASATAEYLRDGQDSGFVAINEDEVVWNLKSGDIAVGAEVAPPVTAAAAGLIDFMAIAGKERVNVYERLFLPPEATLVKKLRKELSAHLEEREIDGVIDVIKANGWEGVDNVYADRGRSSKRKWQLITGKNYGTKTAVDWLPDDWLPAYDGVSIADCDRAIEESRITLKGLEVAQVISQMDVDRGKNAAAALPELEAELKAAEEPLRAARADASDAQAAYDEIRSQGRELKHDRDNLQRQKPTVEESTPCPYCDGALVVRPGGQLLKHNTEAATDALEEWQGAFDSFTAKLDMQAAKLSAADQRRQDADSRAALLAHGMEPLKNKIAVAARDAALVDQEVAEQDHEAVEEATSEISRMSRQRTAVERRLGAQTEHDNVVSYTPHRGPAGPEGRPGAGHEDDDGDDGPLPGRRRRPDGLAQGEAGAGLFRQDRAALLDPAMLRERAMAGAGLHPESRLHGSSATRPSSSTAAISSTTPAGTNCGCWSISCSAERIRRR